MKAAYSAFWFEDERAAAALKLGQPNVRIPEHHLPPYRAANLNERAVLLYMCSIAHDPTAANQYAIPRYWGGRDALARYALGRVLPEGDEADAAKERRSIYESVRQAVEGLINWGAIERIGGAFPGRQQEYGIKVFDLLQSLTARQPEVGPFATCGWVMRSQRLSKGQPEVGPEYKQPKTKRDSQDHLPAVTYLPPVDKSNESEVA